MEERIPKVIHYFWFGKGKKPKIFEKCLKSWKEKCPDYEIKEWTEDDFDVNLTKYTKEAYQMKKYAFVSDYARFYVLYHFGGIYLDVDVEVLRNIDELLVNNMFLGFEDRNNVNPGLIMGAKKGEKVIGELLEIYNNFNGFPNYQHTICNITTDYLIKNKGLDTKAEKIQYLDGITVYPFEYFCACDLITKKISATENTYTVHHYNASWLGTKEKIKNFIKKIVYRILGRDNYDKLKKIIKNRG